MLHLILCVSVISYFLNRLSSYQILFPYLRIQMLTQYFIFSFIMILVYLQLLLFNKRKEEGKDEE